MYMQIHQEISSRTNQLFLVLSIIVYMVLVCYFAFVKQKAQEKAKSHWFSIKVFSFCMYSLHTHKIHQQMNSTNNQLFLVLSIIVYMIVICFLHLSSKRHKQNEISLIFNETSSFCMYSPYTCKIHQEMNSTNNQLFLTLLIIAYIVVVCYFAFVEQMDQEKVKISLIFNETCSFCAYSPNTCKIHQEMNSTNNQVFLVLSMIV